MKYEAKERCEEMLLQFSVSNYRSIRDEQIFSMVASKLTGHEEDNLFDYDEFKILKSAVIYGPNASGKSNFIMAFNYVARMVRNSVQYTTEQFKIKAPVFALDEHSSNQPSSFEVLFVVEGKQYRYRFEIHKEIITFEELTFWPNSREALLFRRKDDEYDFGSYFKEEGKDLKDKTNPRALFLTVAAQFNSNYAKKVMNWFSNFNTISGSSPGDYNEFTAKKIMEDEAFKNKVSAMILKADLGIESVTAEKIEEDKLPKSLPEELRSILADKMDVFSVHKVKTKDGSYKLKTFDMETMESEGTRKYFALAGPIIDTLDEGGVLVIDELDAKLHPLLTRHIIQMFNSKDVNQNNAQLIFATHDTTLLSQRYFRRDQIWFVEKNEDYASELYALSDYKDEDGNSVRKDQSLENEYFQGKYGAVPFIQE